MTNVNDIYSYMLFVARKNQSGGIRKSDFENAYNAAQRIRFDQLKSKIETELYVSELSPFIIANAAITFSSGKVEKPTGLVKLLAMRYNNHPVVRVEHDRIGEVLNDPIDAPSVTDNLIFYSESNQGYHIYPNTITTGCTIDYLKKPEDVVWAHNTDSDGRYTYTSTGSTDSEWDEIEAYKIAGISLGILGVSLNEAALAQFSQEFKQSQI